MGYRSQTKSRGNKGTRKQPRERVKSKAKVLMQQAGGMYAEEEKPVLTPQEIADKTLAKLDKLSTQTFALYPYSQYFDDWLVNLRQVLSDFESNPDAGVDEEFVKKRTEITADVERALAEKRLGEASVDEATESLSDTNHLLGDLDADFAAKNHELNAKRSKEIERLTQKVRAQEEELESIKQKKTSLVFGFTKKAKAQKEAEANQKLNAAKKELEMALQGFDVEQEKLHDEYEKRKATTIEKIRSLEKEIETLQVDGSIEIRKSASAALTEAINALLQRKTVQPS